MHNALKHSQATRVEMELRHSASGLELRVRDDGIGFSGPRSPRGLGLRTMEQRARLMGGRLNVQPAPGGGVEVLCAVPRAVLERAGPG